jgi:hypothetical protein
MISPIRGRKSIRPSCMSLPSAPCGYEHVGVPPNVALSQPIALGLPSNAKQFGEGRSDNAVNAVTADKT